MASVMQWGGDGRCANKMIPHRIGKQRKIAKISRHISVITLGQTWILICWAVAAAECVRCRPTRSCRLRFSLNLRHSGRSIIHGDSIPLNSYIVRKKKVFAGREQTSQHAFGLIFWLVPMLLTRSIMCVCVCISRITLTMDTIVRQLTLVGFWGARRRIPQSWRQRQRKRAA